MEQIIVTRVNGSTFKLQSKANNSVITRAAQVVEMLGSDTVQIGVESAVKMVFSLGDKITIIGRDYTLNQPAVERKISERKFTYDLIFEGVQYDLIRAAYNVNVDTTSNQIQDINGDSLTGDLKRFLDVLISNANRVFPSKWVLGTFPANTETKTLTFGDSDNCLSVLQNLCSESNYNTEFRISINQYGVRTIDVGAIGNVFPFTFMYGRGRGLYELSRQKVSSSNIVTRLNVFGSSKNIMTSKYRAFKLCLPTKSKSQSYLENTTAIAKYGVWESTKNFDDIFPHREGIVSSLGSNELKFIDSSMDFDLNAIDGSGNTLYLIAGTAAKIHFNTGNLAGYDFEIEKYNHTTKEFSLIPFTDENGYTFPSPTSSAFQFATNNKYTITDIYMPQSYIDVAELKLATAGADYLAKYSQPLVSYGLSVDSFFLRDIVGMEVESNLIWVGDYLLVRDYDIDVDKYLRVKGFTRDLLKNYSYSITIADLPVTASITTKVISELNGIENVIKINNLKDPARARRNYKATAEIVNMIDVLQAQAALIGNDPASQYELTGVVIKANYNGSANTIFISSGTIAHNHYPIGNPGTWTISETTTVGMFASTAYYIYIKASKTASTAIYFFSSIKVAVEDIQGFYLFPLGIISSVIDGARVMTTTKGFTLITGDSIKTGRISSNDGTRYFDLSTGEIRGTFTFVSGTSVETAVSNAQTAATNAATAATLAADIARAMQNGKMLNRDPLFKNGVNGIGLYNQAAGSDVALTRVSAIADSPNTTANIKISVKSPYNTSPGLGGFYFATNTRANAVFITRIVAKIPVGYSMDFATNGIGNGAVSKWLSSPNGTGRFEEYLYYVKAGTTGTFSTTNYFYLTGTPATIDWYLSFATVYDITDDDIYTLDKIAEFDYLKTALAGSTDISGGLLATNVILLKNASSPSSPVVAGLSGLTGDNVAQWSGGTYGHATVDATRPFKAAMSTGALDKKDGSGHRAFGKFAWDVLGNIFVKGVIEAISGKLGLFDIIAGNIIGKDSSAVERLRLSIEDIPTVASMASNYSYLIAGVTDTGSFGVQSLWDPKINQWYLQVMGYASSVTTMQVVIPYATYINVESLGVTISEPNLPNYVTGSSYIQSVVVKNMGGTTVASGVLNSNIQILSAGTYNIEVTTNVGVTIEDGSSTYVEFTVDGLSVKYVESVEKTALGKDGFFSYFSSSEYIHFKKSQGLKVKGATDIPGVLGVGSVAAAGGISRQWGAKVSGSQKTATGTYRINHSIGHTDYTIQITPHTSGRLSYLSARYTDYCLVVLTTTAGTATDTAFDFIITGSN